MQWSTAGGVVVEMATNALCPEFYFSSETATRMENTHLKNPSSIYNLKKKKGKKVMKMSTTNKFDFVSYKTGLVPILHKDNGC